MALQEVENQGIGVGFGALKGAGGLAKEEGMGLLKDESRKVAIKLTNNSKQKWINPRIFLDCGAAEELLPLEVEDGTEVEYEVHKKKWRPTGIEGIMSYEFSDGGKKYILAVMFRSPTLSSNKWNATLQTDDPQEASKELYSRMNREGPIVGDMNYTRKEFDKFSLQGAMSSSGTAKLHIIVSTEEGEQTQQEEAEPQETQQATEP